MEEGVCVIDEELVLLRWREQFPRRNADRKAEISWLHKNQNFTDPKYL